MRPPVWGGSRTSTAQSPPRKSAPAPASGPPGPPGRRRSGRWRYRAASSRKHSGWLTVTHPFHPLAGRRVEVLYSMKRGSTRMFVVDTGAGARMTVPVAWTDRGPAAEDVRVS
ncbi:DUF5372 family protein [Streptomyces sp. NPDC002537]